MHATVGWRPLLVFHPQHFGIFEGWGQIFESAMRHILLLRECFCELNLVIVEESRVGDNDEGHGEAQNFENGAGT